MIEVHERPPMTLAVRRATTAPDRIGITIDETVPEVVGLVGERAAGRPVIVRYIEWGATAVVEIGVEVDAPVEGLDLVRVAGGPAAVTVHSGPYSGLAEATARVAEWVSANGELAAPPYEVYLGDETVPPDERRTEIVWPIR